MDYPRMADCNNQQIYNIVEPKKKWCLKKGGEFLSSLRVTNKCGTAAMTYQLSSDKEEAIQICTKSAALTMLAAIECHLVDGFEVTTFGNKS